MVASGAEAGRPIETAPKGDDYITLLVPTRNGLLPFPGRWIGFWCIVNADLAIQRIEPTHWMPLPQPPSADAAVQDATQMQGQDQPEPRQQDQAPNADASGGPCLPHGLPFDAFGEPRVRYVRVSLDGNHCVMHPSEGDTYLKDARDGGDESPYVIADVYLSEREFEDLPEHEGF
jgi:hypothetical protein